MDKIDKLYQNYEILADPQNKSCDHEAEYLEIIQSVKGDTSEKMLACQFIPRFLKDFPNLVEQALDAQLDLVEDDNPAVRKQAVKSLPSICKESRELITKVADILTQMLQFEDSAELATVHAALMTILKMDIKATMEGIFVQIMSTEEDAIRKCAIQFLVTKFKFLPPELVPKDVEEFILDKCKKALSRISGKDFLNLMPLLSNLRITKTVPVQQDLVNMIAEQAQLDAEFDVTSDYVREFLQCIRLALPYFSHLVSSTAFVTYFCLAVLPKLKDIEQQENGEELTIEIVKLLAEVSSFVTKDDHIKGCLDVIHEILLEYLPLPSLDENESQMEEPSFHFTYIECLMYIFSHLLKYNLEFLIADENSQRFKDLKARLQLLARGVQTGIKSYQTSLVSSKAKEVRAEETKAKAITLRSMNNISELVKDFFRTPLTFKTFITLSWKPVKISTTKIGIPAFKRGPEVAGFEERKATKRDTKSGHELYQPPGGKYSTNVNAFHFNSSNVFTRGRGKRFY